MVKNDVITMVAQKTGFTKKDIGIVFDALFESIKESVIAGEDVKIPGVGRYTSVIRAPRTCRNPKTGETCEVPARKVVRFVVSKAFKDAVAGD